MYSLVSLRLGNNELTGRAKWFTNLAKLRTFAVENAGLRGEIDPQIGTLQHLEELRLDNNRLHGSIPKALGGIESPCDPSPGRQRVSLLRPNYVAAGRKYGTTIWNRPICSARRRLGANWTCSRTARV